MATNNNDAGKKEKKTVLDGDGEDNDSGDDSLSLPVSVVIVPALSFENILKEFPDFLFCMLTYIADRVVWNSIASSNKDIHAKSKAILPPWPFYKLPSGSDFSDLIMAWSIYGTRIAYARNFEIAIIDQQRGPFHNNGNNNNDLGLANHDDHYITDLKFSPDGSFLVAIGFNGSLRLWDNVSGNYEPLQQWNMAEDITEEFNSEPKVSVSACSKYIAASVGSCVFVNDVGNGGKTIKALLSFAPNNAVQNIVFSSTGNIHTVLICVWTSTGMHIKVWRPYLDDDDEDRVVTLWRQTHKTRDFREFTFSNDNTMIAMHDMLRSGAVLYSGALWSIDLNQKCLTQKSEFQSECRAGKAEMIRIYFTADDKYIVCNSSIGPTFWSIAEQHFVDDSTYVLNCSNTTKHNRRAFHFSPNNRQLVVGDLSTQNLYITSYYMK